MKSGSSTKRLIAALLMFFMLGFLSVSAYSTSHGQFKHSHLSEDSHHDSDAEHNAHDHDDGAAEEPASTEHSHPHDPLDHTHDIPLRMVAGNATEPPFPRGWPPRFPLPFHSAVPIPLERPPKPLHLA